MQLGSPTRATVYESELVGIHLALQLAATLPTLATDVYIHLDNRAAIQSCTNHPRAQPAQHHLLKIHTSLATLRTTHPNTRFHLNWIPGHEGIPRNEKADKIAKKAADDTTDEPDTPLTQHQRQRPASTRAHTLSLLPNTHKTATTTAKHEARQRANTPSPC